MILTLCQKDIIPRRLQSLNIPEQAAESVQPDEENLQGPPEIDDLLPKKPPKSTSQIKIIWPNGDVRQIIGEFRGKNLSELHSRKIIVKTDGSGIPNGRSATILYNVENITDEFSMMRSFLKRKFLRRHMMVLNQRMVMLKITMRPSKDKMKVLLFSLNLRSKDKCVAEGTLVSKDKTYVIGGNMLEEQYVAVSVSAVSRLGDETLVRPYDKFQTVRDDIGHVLAWPLSHVKKPIPTTPTQLQNKLPNTG